MDVSLQEYVLSLLRPVMLIYWAVTQFVIVLLECLLHGNIGTLLNIREVRDRAFTKMWSKYGPALSVDMAPEMIALTTEVRGVVLDIGPGSGEQLVHFDPSKISTVYGAEPTIGLHAGLRRQADNVGLGGKYNILACGAEPESLYPALSKAGLLSEGHGGDIFDEVVCIRVLCGVPRPQETIKGLYRLLKPGGRLVVYEHVVNPWRTQEGSLLARLMQVFYMYVARWSFWMGNCCLDRDTAKMVKQAGSWEKVDLKGVNSFAAVPHLVGYAVKQR